LAASWIGPENATEAEGIAHLTRAYLRGFGPASWKDIAAWAGVSATVLRDGAQGLDLVRYRDEASRELVDLPGLPLPDPDTPAPVRFLPHWDANLLVHARRTGLLPEEHRARVFHTKYPFSVGTVLVDGRVVAAWSIRKGRIVVEAYEPLAPADAEDVEAERARLEAFHA
jgi:hypothetical protein